MADEKKLKAIQAASGANPFDPASLRLSVKGGIAAKKALLRVPVRKPKPTEFFRVNPAAEYAIDTMLLDYDKEFFLVLPSMWAALQDEAKPYLIHTVINRVGVVSLWPIRIQGEADTRSNGWWDSAHEIAERAKEKWVRCSSNMSLAAYELTEAQIPLPEPEWPEKTPAELLELAFKAQVIDGPDSSVLKLLQGRV